jgi:peptidoglycan/LPS O-acetylase OafA/YrhL
LGILVALSAAALVHFAVTSPNGDITGGWTLTLEQVQVGMTRVMYPFFAGLLLSRIGKKIHVPNAFLWCSLLLIAVLFMPRIGGADHMWMNGLYEAISIIIVFPVIVLMGAGAKPGQYKVSRFLGELSYPLYMTHYTIVYFYVAWVSNHPGITMGESWPYALSVFVGAIILAYLSLKLYDEPVRAWLRKKLK